MELVGTAGLDFDSQRTLGVESGSNHFRAEHGVYAWAFCGQVRTGVMVRPQHRTVMSAAGRGMNTHAILARRKPSQLAYVVSTVPHDGAAADR